MVPLLLFLFLAASANATVTLDSSADSVCPGDTIVFTCATDTGELLWAVGDSKTLFITNITMPIVFPTFDLKLLSQNGKNFTSTATIDNVHLDHNGTAISCNDSSFSRNTTNTANKTVVVAGSSSPPLNLTGTSSTHCSVTISWVAPLDTPLCVHSYTVTIRNSCNSSQVMVYSTTDNRSSLSISDLTSDGEYSVTVAGRDGAGRLGQESEELNFNVSLGQEKFITNFTNQTVFMSSRTYGALLSWNYPEQTFFLIHHNVSSDKRTIKINRPNLTLYGVQQEETYSVEIVPLTCAGNYGQKFSFKIVEAIPNIDEQECAPEWKISENLSVGYIASILGSVVLVFVITCYLLMCVFTKFYVPDKEACPGSMGEHSDVNLFLLHHLGDEDGIIKEVDAAAESVKKNTVGGDQFLPEYDYVRHQ